jgi:hypothetical protein
VPAPPDRRTSPVSGGSPSCAPSFSRSLTSGADISVPVSFARSLSLCVSRGPGSPVPSRCPRASPFLSLRRGPALSIPPSPLSPWTGECAHAHVTRFLGHDACPRAQLPFLEPRQCPAHTPRLTSLDFSLSRALPTLPAAAGDPRPHSRPSSSPESAPSLPELRPDVRHPSSCPISSIAPCARPISPSPVLGRGGPSCSRGGRPI